MNSVKISINLQDVPVYLQSGLLFKSLVESHETEKSFHVLADCTKLSADVTCIEDAVQLLQSLRYWIVSSIPLSIVRFVLEPRNRGIHYNVFLEEWKRHTKEFSKELSAVNTLTCVAETVGESTEEQVIFLLRRNALNEDFLHYFLSLSEISFEGANLELASSIAASGNLLLLQWAHRHGAPWNSTVCANAAFHGHRELLHWARSQNAPWDAKTCANAALNGHLELLQWARQNGAPWDYRTTTWSASAGHLHVLQWTRSQGAPWNSLVCAKAAQNNHLKVLQWAVQEGGAPWDSWTCANAARNGHLELLQWARQHGAPWDCCTCAYAARGGHLDILKWARSEGAPWDVWTCFNAQEMGHDELFTWAKNQGAEVPME